MDATNTVELLDYVEPGVGREVAALAAVGALLNQADGHIERHTINTIGMLVMDLAETAQQRLGALGFVTPQEGTEDVGQSGTAKDA